MDDDRDCALERCHADMGAIDSSGDLHAALDTGGGVSAGSLSSGSSDARLRSHRSPTLGEKLIDPGVDARPVAVQPRSIGRLPFQIEGLESRWIDPMGDQGLCNFFSVKTIRRFHGDAQVKRPC
jgi:hypothetical protein